MPIQTKEPAAKGRKKKADEPCICKHGTVAHNGNQKCTAKNCPCTCFLNQKTLEEMEERLAAFRMVVHNARERLWAANFFKWSGKEPGEGRA